MFLQSILLFSAQAGAIPDFGADFVPSQKGNMNGKYPFQTTPGGRPDVFQERFPREFKDYPGGVESFEVYSPPMTTLYSQVWTAPLAPVDLPADVVKKWIWKGGKLKVGGDVLVGLERWHSLVPKPPEVDKLLGNMREELDAALAQSSKLVTPDALPE